MNEWRDAFHSLYYAFRHGYSKYFYLLAQSFCILWLNEERAEEGGAAKEGRGGLWESLEPRAVLSRTTRQLRAKLRGSSVDFAMPLDQDGAIAREDKNHMERTLELSEVERSRPGSTRASTGTGNPFTEHESETLVVVKGHVAVGGLFELILGLSERAAAQGWGTAFSGLVFETRDGGGVDRADMGSRQLFMSKAPVLLSKGAFLNSSITKATVNFVGSVIDTTGGERRRKHQLEMSGYVLPCAFKDQCLAVSRAAMASDPTTPAELSAKWTTIDGTKWFSDELATGTIPAAGSTAKKGLDGIGVDGDGNAQIHAALAMQSLSAQMRWRSHRDGEPAGDGGEFCAVLGVG